MKQFVKIIFYIAVLIVVQVGMFRALCGGIVVLLSPKDSSDYTTYLNILEISLLVLFLTFLVIVLVSIVSSRKKKELSKENLQGVPTIIHNPKE